MRRQERSGSSPDYPINRNGDDLAVSSKALHSAIAVHQERRRIVDRIVKHHQETGNSYLPIERIIKIVSEHD